MTRKCRLRDQGNWSMFGICCRVSMILQVWGKIVSVKACFIFVRLRCLIASAVQKRGFVVGAYINYNA